jgi:uncharacterized protein YfaS (alpha-2-macroglobulin family)
MAVTSHARTFGCCLLVPIVLLACFQLLALPALARSFPVEAFSHYVSEYNQELGRLAVTKTEAEIEADIALAESAGNARLAAASIEQLLTRRSTDGTLWLKLAQKLSAAEPINEQDESSLPSKIIGAGLKAYLLARVAPDEAAALAIVAKGFAKLQMWSPALQAYRESLRLAEGEDVRQEYDALRAEHGFRVTDYKVETDTLPPRLCLEFSNPISRTINDLSPYIKLEPGPLAAVTVENTRLCAEGLKHGESYKLIARKGLPAAIDDVLAKDFEFEFYVRDRNSSVRFSSKSFVLPRTGQKGIPLISVNSGEARLRLYRIGDRNLIAKVMSSDFRAQITGYGANDIADRDGALVWQGTMETPSPLNEEVTTAFPVDEALGKLEPGLYVMTARPASIEDEDYVSIATQWFVVSDLGLSTMKSADGLRVGVRSIATADVLANVEVRLLARNNDVLATAKTSADGKAHFAKGLINGTGGLAPALVVARTAAGDYSFVDLTTPAFDLSDRGVIGRPSTGAIDAFVYAERGVYRRGETVHITALLRDADSRALTGVPLTLIIERPDGVQYWRGVLDDQGAGGRTFDLAIDAAAQGGTWRVKALADPNGDPVGQTSFLVEDYIPDRIEFDLKAKSARASVDTGASFTVDGRYLFGAPAAGLQLEANLTLTADNVPFPQWKGFQFGLMDERLDPVQIIPSALPQTDAKGHAEISIGLPDLPATTKPVKADVAVRMRESGGRAVEETVSLPVLSLKPMIGIKAQFKNGAAPEGLPAAFQVIAIDPEGKLLPLRGAAWTLKRLEIDYQWFNSDGYWRYEAVTRTQKIANGQIDIGAEAPATFSWPLSWGEYRLEFVADGFAPASIDFSSGYYSGETAEADTPDTLQLVLDKSDVRPGDTINVKIEARYPGKATLQIMSDRLLAEQVVDVPEGGTTVPVTIGDDWGTGAYVLGTLFRPMDAEARRMPTRAIGVAWFGIDRAGRTLNLQLTPQEVIKPRQQLTVPVKVEGFAPGEDVYLTMAAVDVGILNLTRYDPPAPENHYFDQKRLSAELRDIYSVLLDGMQGERGRLRSGGDAGAGLAGPPPSQQPLSQFSGIVKVGADGTVNVDFAIPAFNGTVRVMAVAWSKTKVGHASSDVIVRDPVVLAETLPRFLALGDKSYLRFDLLNSEALSGEYTFDISVDGPLRIDEMSTSHKIHLGDAGSRASISIPVTAIGTGTSQIAVSLRGPGDLLLDQSYALSLVPANPTVTRRRIMELATNLGSLVLGKDLLADVLEDTASVALSVSPLPEVDVAGLIRDLDLYPYGCSEQTVSRALPLLYLSELGVDPDVLDGGLQDRMTAAVARLVNRQAGNGSFGFWSAESGDSNLWLSSFVTDFLLRAREKGFEVPEDVLVAGLDYLRNMVGNAPDIQTGQGEDMAYALYVLARAGRAPVGDLKYLTDTKIDEFGSPMARAQVGAALAILGDRARSELAFARAIKSLDELAQQDDRSYRSDYGSLLRDASAILTLAVESKAQQGVVTAASHAVAGARAKSQYLSTQDMAWMVLAARAVAKEAQSIRLDAAGKEHEGALYEALTIDDLEVGYTLTNRSNSRLRAVVAVTGSPLVAQPAIFNGLVIDRQYFTPAGEPADIATVAQNTRLVAVLTVKSADGNEQDGNFLLVDPLPAGLEIENPALVTSGNLASLAWLNGTTPATYTEFRDDRFVASFASSTAKLAYMVRAVAPGTYTHPGASVEDMYRPELNARTAPGTVAVTGGP